MISLADLADGPDRSGDPIRLEDWNEAGVVRLPGLIPDDVIDAYCAAFIANADRKREINQTTDELERRIGWGIGAAYLNSPEMRDLCLYAPLVNAVEGLVGDRMGVHLNLTGWKSTQRAWHIDLYLSPPYVGSCYAATWIALDDIHPDSGPFEFVPGSHLWPAPTQAKVLAVMGEDGSDPDWPWRSEALLGPLYDREIVNRGAHIERFIAKKGDVLIWHANTVHRGSVPKNPDLERRTLISHYSCVSARRDMRGTERRWKSEHADGMFFALGPVT